MDKELNEQAIKALEEVIKDLRKDAYEVHLDVGKEMGRVQSFGYPVGYHKIFISYYKESRE